MGNFSFNVPFMDLNQTKKELYHIALAYSVKNISFDTFDATIAAEDVNGSLWLSRNQIHKNECSPLLRSPLNI